MISNVIHTVRAILEIIGGLAVLSAMFFAYMCYRANKDLRGDWQHDDEAN